MPSDALLHFALYSGLVVFLLIIVLLITIAVLHYATGRRKRRENVLSKRWQPAIFHAIEGLPYEVPRIRDRDREIVLLLWILFMESIRGEARQRLRQLALDLGLDHTAHKYLRRRNIRSRIMAIVALGRMQSIESWDEIVPLVADPNPMLSLLAARGLLQIDAAVAIQIILVDLIGRRDDWPLRGVAEMLSEVPQEVLSYSLLNTIKILPPQSTPRLLRLLATAHLGDTWPVLEPLLSIDQSPEVLAAAIKACSDPRALGPIRMLATHAQWIVRAQVAAALGRMGIEEDFFRLQSMLGDSEWWVRYRAALALVQLPFVSRQKLMDLCTQLNDRFAADILNQALAETAPKAVQ